jgi:hypothetical protein
MMEGSNSITGGNPQWINIAIIHTDADSDFGASFPDFPGCTAAEAFLR